MTMMTSPLRGEGATLVDLNVPQFGEGIHEVRIVSINKPVGASFEQDEIVYELETVKSAFSIESEFEGRIVEWLVAVGDTVAVGSTVARMAVSTGPGPSPLPAADPEADEMQVHVAPARRPDGAAARRAGAFFIPPRTRAYAREKAVAADELERIVPAGRKVMPADIDAFIEKRIARPSDAARTLSPAQRLQNQQFAFSKGQLVTATMVAVAPYNHVRACLKSELSACAQASAHLVTPLQLISFYIAQVAKDFEKFRSVFLEPSSYRVAEQLNLGLAVQTDGQGLAIAVVQDAGSLDFAAFVEHVVASVESARSGGDQAAQRPQIVVSYLGGEAIVHGCPLLVIPSVATIAVGAVDSIGLTEPRISLSMTFDHRLITGMEASGFLQAILRKLEGKAIESQAVPEKRAASRPGSKEAFAQDLVDHVSRLLHVRIPAETMDESLGLLGLDSMNAKALVAYLGEYFGESFQSTFLWHQPTLSKIVDHCVDRFGLTSTPPAPAPAVGDLDHLLSQIRGELATKQAGGRAREST